jgi:Protein of unknown function (DUF998)
MPTRTFQPRPVTAIGRGLPAIGIAASVSFVVLLAALHVIQRDLDPTWRFVSEYALGTGGFLMAVAFLALAIASVSVGALYWGQARTLIGRIGVVLAGISGLGMLIAAICPTDPINTAPDDATLNGTLHMVGGQLNLTPLAILLITIGLGKNTAWRSIRPAQLVVVATALVVAVAFGASSATAHDGFGPGDYAGLFGRIMLVAYAAWVIVSGVHALRLSRVTAGSQPSRHVPVGA